MQKKESESQSVAVVVVTFNRLEMLKRTLQLLESQTRPVSKIIVVNNASTDDTANFLACAAASNGIYEVYNLTENLGGAGGFSYGMQKALESPCDWVWIMDDDAFAAPDCLYRLMKKSDLADVLVPVQVNEQGLYYGTFEWNLGPKTKTINRDLEYQPAPLFTFVGPLFKRQVLENVGLPNESYFICFDDIEYSIRISNKGYKAISVHGAIIHHSYGQGITPSKRFGIISMRPTTPPWKNYYICRNEFFLARCLPNNQAILYRLYLTVAWFRGAVGEILFDVNWKEKIKYRFLGIRDALLNRAGRRVSP